MAFGIRDLKYSVLGPSGCMVFTYACKGLPCHSLHGLTKVVKRYVKGLIVQAHEALLGGPEY